MSRASPVMVRVLASGAEAADDRIVAEAAGEQVVAGAAVERVGAAVAGQRVVEGGAREADEVLERIGRAPTVAGSAAGAGNAGADRAW
jgi:hypothetical protein